MTLCSGVIFKKGFVGGGMREAYADRKGDREGGQGAAIL